MTGNQIRNNLDRKTLRVMIEMYCNNNHDTADGDLCEDCADLMLYSIKRYDSCSFKQKGRLCSDCIVQCYEEYYRKRIREIMLFSGPRMISRHPALALRYLVMKLKNKYDLNRNKDKG